MTQGKAPDGSRPSRVVILGGGFAGVHTAMALEKLRGLQTDLEITLVNRENYFVYQPMLPEIISGSIGIFDTVSPLRRLLRKTSIQVRTVEAVDLENRVVTTSPGFKPVPHQIPYDHLVLALGNVSDFRRIPGLTQHALPFKYLGDALYLRNHVIHALEEASIEADPTLRRALLTFVVVGGGFSGVECAAELNDFVRGVAGTYRDINPSEIRVILLEIADRILPDLVESLRALGQRELTKRGVEVRLRTGIAAASGDEVILSDGSRLSAKTLVSTVPSGANPIIEGLKLPKERGRIKVDLTMQVEGSDHIWALGDCALIPDPGGNGFCPPTAQYAIREAPVAAHNIVRAIRGSGQAKEFAFRELGKMGALGHHSAVAEILGMKFSGLLAWLIWRGVYLLKLPGWDRQLRTGLSWLMDMVLPADTVQLKIDHGQGIVQEHYETGQTVFNQKDLGDRLYIVVKGRCQVVRTENGVEYQLAELGPGECFGEMALINQTVRSATVRVIEPLDVLSIPKPDVAALVGHLPALRESLEELIAERQQKR
jgi:NADH dehydrogenase